jgi:hypothetical protein
MRLVVRLARASVAVLLCALTPAAEAETRACADRTAVVERLETRFGETRQSVGLNDANGIVEIFASPETGTWTILVTTPDGKSCLLASGNLWEQVLPILGRARDA